MTSVEWFFLISVIAYVLYKWATAGFETFKDRGIPFKKPLPFFGNSLPLVWKKKSFFTTILGFYQESAGQKVYGVFNFRDPIIMIRDRELIKKITIKDFEHFPNHVPFFNTTNKDDFLSHMVMVMKDQRWKDMRNTLTPIFTASKMRAMFPLINECCLMSIENLKGLTKGESHDLEMKEYFTRWSNDVIASSAFGLKINSYADRDNEFYTIGKTVTNFRGKAALKFVLYSIVPKLMTLLKVKPFDEKMTNYFVHLVIDTMNIREEKNIVRPDMIHLLMEAKKATGDKQRWNDEEIVAQCFVFFFAAFENNANLVCTTCHELMENPVVQEKLHEEVATVHGELNGEALSYDVVQKMKYMEMVISEVLRKWSVPATDRLCSMSYALTDDEGNFVANIEPGDRIWIPVIGLHYDEENFEDPQAFRPERFSDDNKDQIKPFSYMPFGVGPRNCIANRYAMMVAKAMVFQIVLNFKLERAPKTSANLMEDLEGFQMQPKNGFWVKFTTR